MTEFNARVGFQSAEQAIHCQKQVSRRQQGVLRIAAQQLVAALGITPEIFRRRFHSAVQTEQGIGREVIEQAGGGLKKQRQVILNACRSQAVADILVELAFRSVALETVTEILAEARNTGLVERKFTRRQQTDFLDGINAALGVDVKRADGLDLVVKQVDAIRQRAAHREQIQQAAAHAVFAGRHHLAHGAVTRQRHLSTQRVQIEFLALFQEKGIGTQIAGRCQAIQRSRHRHDGHIALSLRNLIQRCQSLGHQILVRRKVVVGQGFPVRQQIHLQRGRKPADFCQQALRIERVGGEHHQRAGLCCQLGQRQSVGRAGERR